jgi:hypothetical protein
MFSPTGPNTALIGSVLAETCRVTGTVDFVLRPKTPPIVDLCRSYRLCGHEAYSLALSPVDFFILLGGGLKDAGWNGENLVPSQLAILPSATHYNIVFRADLLLPVLSPFLKREQD